MQSRARGSYEGWNEVWKTQSQTDLLNVMYCEDEPQTIFQFWQRGYARDLLTLVREKGYNSFCELGSGRGTTTMHLAREGYTDLTMIDLAEQAFDVARYNFSHYNLAMPNLVLGDVEATGLSDESFDCIYNIGLLEHFDDPTPTLAESYRLLKKGGMIFMPIVPELPIYKSFAQRLFFSPISLAKILIKNAIGYKKSNSAEINRTNLRRPEYVNICDLVGFDKIECLPYNPFWKVNLNRNFEQKITLPVYRWIYRNLMDRKKLTFKTVPAFELCYLLVAFK